jgi:hypothetical protein
MRKAHIALATGAVAGSAAIVACVLADPPPIQTPPPLQAPFIITGSVTPPPLEKIRANPPCPNGAGSDCFVVPVMVDPNAAVAWRVFVDLDPKGAPAPSFIESGQDDGGVLGVTGEAGTGVRNISFALTPTTWDPTQCHTFTFVVAYGFTDSAGGDFARPVTPPGGDSVTWFYEPVSDCSFFDAGTFPEGGTD